MVSTKAKASLALTAAGAALLALSLYSSNGADAGYSVRRRLNEDTSIVTSITLIGERHSGTNWITDHLNECFGEELKIKVSYARFKHWFQFNTQNVEPKSTVVVTMFRDPYDWVEAMHERPHHAHTHMNLPWRDFVTKPWRGPRRINDYHLLKKSGNNEQVNTDQGTTCVSNYTWNEVIPCSYDDFELIDGYARYMYELMHDGSGRAYPSIVDLRRDKILNFLTMDGMMGVKSFHPTRYEDLYKDGTAALIEMLEGETGRKAKCEPIEGKGVVKHKEVPKAFIRWMNEFVDWDVEGMIGYSRREA